MKKIPVILVGGFLGAGKTTLVNHVLRGDHGMRVAVLVNDFGSLNIDSELISNVEGETIALANGCVCCTIRDDLALAVEDILGWPQPPDAVLVETSGVSEPSAAAMGLVMSSRLAGRISLDLILTVVDAEHLPGLAGEQAELAREQVAAADAVLVNKTDLVDDAALASVRRWITEVAPRARVLETRHCNVPGQLLFGPAESLPRARLDAHAHDRHGHRPDHGFASWSWQHGEALALEPLYALFQALPPAIFRAKGTLNLAEVPGRRVLLQVVGRRVQFSKGEPWHDEPPASRILMIGLEGEMPCESLSQQLQACLASNAGPSSNPFAEAVINVLRL